MAGEFVCTLVAGREGEETGEDCQSSCDLVQGNCTRARPKENCSRGHPFHLVQRLEKGEFLSAEFLVG